MKKVLILDLGGVLLNIDYKAPVRAFSKLGITDFDELYSQASQSRLFDDLETGRISPEEFREGIRKLSGLELKNEDIDQAWNSILLDMPQHRMDLLKRLGESYRLFLLSNTNEIHIRSFEAYMDEVFGKGEFNRQFEEVFYSSRLNDRKPHVTCFQLVLEKIGAKGEEVFFIDDSPQHIEGARSAGINALHLPKGLELKSLLERENLI